MHNTQMNINWPLNTIMWIDVSIQFGPVVERQVAQGAVEAFQTLVLAALVVVQVRNRREWCLAFGAFVLFYTWKRKQ